jgi:N-acetylneuraminic acid mutarotase
MCRQVLRTGIVALTVVIIAGCSVDSTEPTLPAARLPGVPDLAVTSNIWLTKADMPGPERFDLTAATVTNAAGQSIVYAIGGRTSRDSGAVLSKVMAYNVATNTWATRALLPAPLWGMNQAAVLNGKIYVTGGCAEVTDGVTCGFEPARSSLYVYDPGTNTWTPKRDMPTVTVSGIEQFAGMSGVSGFIAGQLYVLTGCFYEFYPGFPDCSPDLFFRYNPVTDRWTVLPRPAGTFVEAGGVIEGKFYAVGFDGSFKVYDPATNRWTTKAALPDRYVRIAASAVMLRHLYMIGGERSTGTGETMLRRNLVYDPAADTWTTKAPLPTARVGVAATKVFLNGQPRIEVVGGRLPGNNLQYTP